MQDRATLRAGAWLTAIYMLLEWTEHAIYHSSHDVAPWDPSSGIAFAALLLGDGAIRRLSFSARLAQHFHSRNPRPGCPNRSMRSS